MRLRSSMLQSVLIIFIAIMVGRPSTTAGADWPQWRGVNRDGKSDETGLLSKWPQGGPRLLWKASGAGTGYSSLAVSDGRIFTMGNLEEKEYILAFSADGGEPLWQVLSGGAFRNDRGSGPRSTPTVDGDMVYTLGGSGDLTCVTTSGGDVWKVNILQKFGSPNITFGISESVLIEDDMVICNPGGEDNCVVALDKRTGKIIWMSTGLNDRASYSGAVATTVDGVRQIIHFTGDSAVGIRADDGVSMWRNTSAINGNAIHVAAPVVRGRHVFFTSAYGTGCALLKLSSEGGRTHAKEVYFNKVMKNHHGGVVELDGFVYGASNKFVCMEMLTGTRKWRDDGPGKCSLIYADGHLYCLSQDGVMSLVEVNPDAYVEKGRFVFKAYEKFKLGGIGEEDEKPTWTVPVIANAKLLLRDQDNIYCYDIADSALVANR